MKTDDIRKLEPGRIITMLGTRKLTVLPEKKPINNPGHPLAYQPPVDPDLFQAIDENGMIWSWSLHGLTDIPALS